MNPNELAISALLAINVPAILLRADCPNFTVLAYNDAYKDASYTHFRDITGWHLKEVFSSGFSRHEASVKLIATLNEVILIKGKISTAVFQFEAVTNLHAAAVNAWWQLDVLPFFDEEGSVTEMIIVIHNIIR